MKRTSRRKFLKRTGKALALGAAVSQVGVGTALAESGVVEAESRRKLPFDMPTADTPMATNGLLAGIPTDKPFHGTWKLVQVIGPVAGGLTLLLEEKKGQRPTRVDLCLIGGEPKAPIHTRYLELYVMDGGGGESCIEESLFDALEVVAQRVSINERDPRLLEGILTFEERWETYPDYMASAAVELIPGEGPRKP